MDAARKAIIGTIIALSVVLLFTFAFSLFRSPGQTRELNPEEANEPEASIFVSEDAGVTWRGIPGTKDLPVTLMKFGRRGTALYVGTRNKGLWKSADAGKTFGAVTAAEEIIDPKARIDDIAPLEGGKDAYIAGYSDGKGRVYEFFGSSFKEIYFTPLARTSVTGIAADPDDPRHLYILSSDGAMHESDNAGAAWKVVSRFNEIGVCLLSHPQIPNLFWKTETGGGGLSYSTTSGKSWQPLRQGLAAYQGAANIQNIYYDISTDALYITTDYGLLVSADYGKSWDAFKISVPPDSLPMIALAINPQDPQTMYVSAASQLYKSTDGGESWKGRDFGGRRRITSIALDPRNPKRIFISFDR